jgi:hypothetical protein
MHSRADNRQPSRQPSQHRPSPESVWTATGHERPVFLDERGRRRRWVLLGGAFAGGLSALWMGGLLAGAIGFSSLPSIRPLPQVIRAETRVPVEIRAPAEVRFAAVVHFGRGGDLSAESRRIKRS